MKINLFAVGDTFGNVALYEHSIEEKKCNLVFLHKNNEIGYSIENLCFDDTGKLLIASTSKHFLLLFYIGSLKKIKFLKKISKKNYFKESSLNNKNAGKFDKIHFNNFEENFNSSSHIHSLNFNTNKTNKPVFFRKKNVPAILKKKQKRKLQKIF